MEPILPYLVSALGLIGSLFMFFSLKREMQAQSRAHHQKLDGLAACGKAAEEQAAVPEPCGPSLSPGFNRNRRVQALGMLRRGEDATHIAAALGIPEREVDLLIRVQRITAGSSIPVPR